MKPMLTHPDWYSEAAFAELVDAARGTAEDLAAVFGIDLRHALRKSSEQDQSAGGRRDIDPEGPASALTLADLKKWAPRQPKLIPLPEDAFAGAYRCERIDANVGGAVVPALVQVWASEFSNRTTDYLPSLVINRTPTFAELSLHVGGDSYIRGCGLEWTPIGTVPKGSYLLTVAITTPAIALISDGKTPDLTPFRHGLVDAIGPVLRRAHRPRSRTVSIKDAAYDVMEQAYLKASAGGTLPANARQIMYAARPFILEQTGIAKLGDAYFTQTLLPAFIEENPTLTAEWDVVYDARGHLVEPHTGRTLPLGTLQVRDYLRHRERSSTSLISTALGLHPTVNPADRYGAVLFLEKEGFDPLLRKARISERFDVAVMSTKGMSVIAARALVDRLSGEGVKILVAHDLDMSGIRIFGTLGGDSSRYQFENEPDLHRLGLTLGQARDMDLQTERQDIKGDHDRILDGLRQHGASEEELAFIMGGERVELNAMPSDQFVSWIEAGLRFHGVRKVIPAPDLLEQRARQIIGIEHLQERAKELERQAKQFAATAPIPTDLVERMEREFGDDPALPWEDALGRALAGARNSKDAEGDQA